MSNALNHHQAIASAIAYHEAGRVELAERGYRQILAQSPDNADVLHLLGMLAGQTGRASLGAELIGRAIRLNPSSATYHNSLGKLLARTKNFERAGACFVKAIEIAPQNFEAHNNLGITLREQRQWDEAVACYLQAIKLRADYPEAWYNLGNVLRDQRKFEEAVAAFRRAIELRPGLLEAHNNLGNVLSDTKKFPESIAVYRKLVEMEPRHATAHNNLAGALREAGHRDEALAALDRAIQLKPDYARAHANRGVVLHQQNRMEESIAAFTTAIRLAPDIADSFYQLSSVLKDQGRLDEAIAMCRRAIALNPDYADAWCGLGNLFQHHGDVDNAIDACRRAIAINPDLAEAHNVLGNAMRDQGLLDEAIDCYQRAMELKPEDAGIHSNLVFTINFHAGWDAQRILEENRRWADRFEKPVLAKGHVAHGNDRSRDRRLKIGYVSPDFRRHPAASFMLPLLANHDSQNVEIFCYSGVKVPDAITEECRKLPHVWRDVAPLSDAELAEMIRSDGIDILVDLTLHMAGNRLLTYARKPAPVQITWLGYPGTTGLSSIDYRLTDPYLDPAVENDRFYVEKSVRLPHTFWCYQPLIQTPDVNSLPALQTGRMTFACFNHFAKVTPPTLSLWCQTLSAIADSRMIILCSPGSHRERVLQTFERGGVARERIEFVSRLAPEDYFRIFHRVDVCLDPIPYPGHTSTLDSLWMGVPAITLRGQTAAARGGASILTNIGLASFIAETEQEYVDIARKTAADFAMLSDLRSSLREKMLASPLTDGPLFAASIESAYRQLWTESCLRASVK